MSVKVWSSILILPKIIAVLKFLFLLSNCVCLYLCTTSMPSYIKILVDTCSGSFTPIEALCCLMTAGSLLLCLLKSLHFTRLMDNICWLLDMMWSTRTKVKENIFSVGRTNYIRDNSKWTCNQTSNIEFHSLKNCMDISSRIFCIPIAFPRGHT